jgi:hypothetical protein
MRLSRYLFWMGAFLLAVLAVAAWMTVRLKSAFLANPFLNGLLVVVWLIGIGYIIAQTLRLGPEIRWVHAVQRSRLAVKELEPPPLMGSLARLMEDRQTPLMLTPQALRAVLDGIAVRLDESRETARYFIGLMIFLGLLGTFWGLLRTVGSIGGVVSGLSVTADPTELFSHLKAGLEGPLAGMGVAFSSSLLGLAGSLVLGFLDLQLGQAQNRFFVDLEDWLFASTSGGGRGLDEEASPAAYLQALVKQTSENIDKFGQIVGQAEERNRQTADAISSLSKSVGELVAAQDRARDALGQSLETDAALAKSVENLAAAHDRDRDALSRLAESDAALVAILGRFDQALGSGELGGGAALREQLAAIETGVRRIVEDQANARQKEVEDMRNEVKRLVRLLDVTIDEEKVG